MTDHDHVTAIIRDEETAAVGNVIAARLGQIEHLPHGPVRARLCAAASLTAGYQMMKMLEGNTATIRQLRRIADQLEAEETRKC